MPNSKRHLLARLLKSPRAWLPLALSLLPLAGCRLYDPPRYARLKFPARHPSTRVLMIGNSLTYYNDLPGLLQQFSIKEPAPIDIQKITTPLASLQFHWDLGAARDRIRKQHWDYVVLQEFSRKPVTDPAQTEKYFSLFDGEIKKTGATTLLFENWTRQGLDADTQALQSTYQAIVSKTGATPLPIGAAFALCRKSRPDIPLLLDDRHPSDAGTYLAAAVLYDVIYQKKSTPLPGDLPGPKLPADEMHALRAFADQATATPAPAPTPAAAR